MSKAPPHLVLYTAQGCCLCDTLYRQLQELRGEFPFSLETVEITGNDELERLYRPEIPVLTIDGRKSVKYRITTPALRQRLELAAGDEPDGPLQLR